MNVALPDGVANVAVADLDRSGIVLASFDSPEDFLRTCRELGQILSIVDVALVDGSRRHVSSPYSIPFHTDGPAADVVAWFCIRQDEDDGESVLMDAIPAIQSLDPAIRRHLGSVSIPYFDHSTPGRPSGYCAVLRGEEEQHWRINYAPWLLPDMTDVQKEAVAAFDATLAKLAPTKIRLKPNQALFIDNWRVLHARGGLKPNSRRHLKRAWIRTGRNVENGCLPA
ncbi:TauD/TfdA family dioxygenase [Phyllobacterium sp. P5_D12]